MRCAGLLCPSFVEHVHGWLAVRNLLELKISQLAAVDAHILEGNQTNSRTHKILTGIGQFWAYS